MIFKRSTEEQISIRQKIVRYAQQHGNKPAARHYGCDVRTVREWRGWFAERGNGALMNKSRAPHTCPHKIAKDVEERVVQRRKEAPCYGPKRLKFFNPSPKASEGAIYRILKEQGMLAGGEKTSN
jgi:hypothetical protein